MQITTGIQQTALKVVIYGPEGIGKSTMAAAFPDPVFIDTEGSTKYMDVARLPKPTSAAMLLDEVRWARDNSSQLGTLVLDTADWAEQMISADLCARNKKSSIEDFGYGKGYTYLSEEFGHLLNLLEEVVNRGVNVVVTAHAQMRKFEQPDEMGAYDRWELKLQKKTAPLLKEWADMLLFANYKTYAVRTNEGKVKAQGGSRVMYATHHPCWDAKNRQGLPDEMPFSFDAIRHCVPNLRSPAPVAVPSVQTAAPDPIPVTTTASAESAPQTETPANAGATLSDENTPAYLRPLYDLMSTNGVYPEEVEAACVVKGYAPQGMPLKDYPEDFVTGCLIAAWDQVFSMILENRPVPF